MLTMLTFAHAITLAHVLAPPMRPVLLRARPLIATQPDAPDFDDTLRGILANAKTSGSMAAAVDSWLEGLDDTFIPELGARIADTEPSSAELPRMNDLMTELQGRSQQRFERARDQLQTLLTAGEINRMDSQLAGLVRRGEIDAGFLYVLLRNLEDAQRDNDEGGVRLLTHIHTRTQELLEGRAEPALALLHKLTRLDQASIRLNLLRHNLVPQTSAPLPGGGVLPLATPAPATVSPLALAAAIEGALDKICALTVDPAAKLATVEEIKTVAKEARAVVEEAYDAKVLDAFSDSLQPAFMRAMSRIPPRPLGGEPKLVKS
jgi:hypothetical protein